MALGSAARGFSGASWRGRAGGSMSVVSGAGEAGPEFDAVPDTCATPDCADTGGSDAAAIGRLGVSPAACAGGPLAAADGVGRNAAVGGVERDTSPRCATPDCADTGGSGAAAIGRLGVSLAACAGGALAAADGVGRSAAVGGVERDTSPRCATPDCADTGGSGAAAIGRLGVSPAARAGGPLAATDGVGWSAPVGGVERDTSPRSEPEFDGSASRGEADPAGPGNASTA